MLAERRAGETADLATRLDCVMQRCWPELRGRVIGDNGGCRCVLLRQIVEPRPLSGALATFAKRYPGGDRRALASLFLQWYLATSWPPLVTGLLMLGRVPAPESSAIRLDESGTPAGLTIQGAGAETGTQPGLEILVRDHAAALITGILATTVRMSPRVLWSNVLNVLGWTLERLEGVADAGRLHEAHAFLSSSRLPDGSGNPLWIRQPREWRREGRPPRRTCCLRFRLAGVDYCSDCPVPSRRRH